MDEEAARLAYQGFLAKAAAKYGRQSKEYQVVLAKANNCLLKALDQINPEEKYLAGLAETENGSLAINKLLGKLQTSTKTENRQPGALMFPSPRTTA
jgi:hypothetical protein